MTRRARARLLTEHALIETLGQPYQARAISIRVQTLRAEEAAAQLGALIREQQQAAASQIGRVGRGRVLRRGLERQREMQAYAAQLITALDEEHERMQRERTGPLGAPTLTPTLSAGGHGLNIVPESAYVSVDYRVTTPGAEGVSEDVDELFVRLVFWINIVNGNYNKSINYSHSFIFFIPSFTTVSSSC